MECSLTWKIDGAVVINPFDISREFVQITVFHVLDFLLDHMQVHWVHNNSIVVWVRVLANWKLEVFQLERYKN